MTGRDGRATGQRPASQRGVVLIAILWVVALLAVMATGVSVYARTEARLARNLIALEQARQAAEGGIHLALRGLLRDTRGEWRGDGSAHRVRIGDAVVDLAVLDEAGRIDLNAAPVELIAGLLGAAEVPEPERARLADVILDWRDDDDLRRLNGAEDADYRAAGMSYGAKDAPFDSVEELALVLGMNADIYRRIRHAVTVHSREPGVNPEVAGYDVLLAIPGVTPDQAGAYLNARANRDRELAGVPLPFPVVDQRFLSSARGMAVTVYARAQVPSGAQARISATAGLGQADPAAPFSILGWRLEQDMPAEVREAFDRARADEPATGGSS